MNSVATARLARQTAERLIGSRAALQRTPAILGFDGFLDHIYHAVDTRKSATEYTRIKTLKQLGTRIAAAAGQSTNLEIVPQAVKLGGNGPIMAFAMSSLGVPVTYIGLTGTAKDHHAVFNEFYKRATVIGIGEPAVTDAIECEDGKLMVGKHATTADVTYDAIRKKVGDGAWKKLWDSARFVGMVNWTMLPHMSAIWRKIQSDLMPKDPPKPVALGKDGQPGKDSTPRKQIFFDLADPEKRSDEDIATALKLITKFQGHYDVTLGMNEKESVHIAKVCGAKATGKGEKFTVGLAASIREQLGVHTTVIHPVKYAAAADPSGSLYVPGPFTSHPKITTGAGDHFNAGFCIARLLGSDLPQALQLGVSCSGYYVRTAQSPSREQLVRFLQTL
jgi:sugar/nucleoside kinase (ribokinase family)